VVILAMPYEAALALASSSALKGKTLVDISNPLKPDFSGLSIGHDSSAAETIQRAASGVKVVKAFNTIFAAIFDSPASSTRAVPVYLAGNDDAAVEAVAELVATAGFAVERTGALDAARLIEPLAMLNIRLGYALGRGTAIAPSWMKIAA
jgi:8-hydroxy-5-deazaflavin:NADPH oxidoreductase